MEPALFTSSKDDWRTPKWLFDQLDSEFHFNVDLCADDENHLCEEYYTIERDGMSADLTGKRVFCNPPYGRTNTARWIEKCAESGADVAVMLIPARTDTAAFHEYIYGKAEVRFLRGRLRFSGSAHDAPFPSMLVIFRRERSR
jgi:site-specific DNA-methyltransferase (adenine-specific)